MSGYDYPTNISTFVCHKYILYLYLYLYLRFLLRACSATNTRSTLWLSPALALPTACRSPPQPQRGPQ